MNYIQLEQPNLNTGTGKVGFCLAKQEDVWGVPHGVYLTAKAAWDALPAQYKHPGELPPSGVYTIAWWSYFVGKVDEGHTATCEPNASYLSSPYSASSNAAYQQGGTTQAVLPSKAELERIYSNNGQHPLTYLGWSEMIGNKRVVRPQGDTPMNEGDRVNINVYLYGEDRGRFKAAVGMDWKTAMYSGVFETAEFKIDELVNTGDLANINAALPGDAKDHVGKPWKNLFYEYIAPNASAEFEPIGQLYVKK